MEFSRVDAVRDLLNRWRKSRCVIRMSLHSAGVEAATCFTVEMSGFIADPIGPSLDDFGLAVGDAGDVPLNFDLVGAFVQQFVDEDDGAFPDRYGSFFELRLRDGSTLLARELLAPASIN